MDVLDQGHGGSMVPDALVRPGISPTRTTAARTTTRIRSDRTRASRTAPSASRRRARGGTPSRRLPCRASIRGTLHDRAPQPAVAELLERVHVLDLRHRPPDVELAHRGDLAVDPRAEEPRAGVAFELVPEVGEHPHDLVRRGPRLALQHDLERRTERGQVDLLGLERRRRPVGARVAAPSPRAGPRRIRPRRGPRATDLPYASSSIRISRCVRPASPSTRSASAASALGIGALRGASTQRKLLSQRSRYPSFRYAVPHANGTSRVLTLATNSRSNASVRASVSGSGDMRRSAYRRP